MTPNSRNGQATKSNGVFDYEETLSRLGGDTELFSDLVRFFLEDADELTQRLRTKLIANDLRGIEMCAHSLKGLCANFGAHRATSAAMTLEDAAKAGQTANLQQATRDLEAAVADLKAALAVR